MTPVEHYESLLRELNQAERRGGDLAVERLCEEMDGPWHKLTSDEQDRMRDLAAGLDG
jgi:hypothetical protein